MNQPGVRWSMEGQEGGGLTGIRAVIVAAALGAVLAKAPQAGPRRRDCPKRGSLVVGTKVAPPFAVKAEDGT